MNIYTIVSIFLIILFFCLLFYYIYENQNKIISYQTTKQKKEKDYDLSKLKKYKKTTCNDYCSNNLCDHYHTELYNYKKCLNCQKDFKCYNVFTNNCENCISFGINQCKMPLNPKNNFCK